jgi:hypothetical protein
MRITVSIEDDVYREVKEHAESRKISLDEAISGFVRRGMNPAFLTKRLDNGFWVADLPPGTPTVTAERVKEIQEEMDLEDAKRAMRDFRDEPLG